MFDSCQRWDVGWGHGSWVPVILVITHLKTNECPLKIDVWKMIHSFPFKMVPFEGRHSLKIRGNNETPRKDPSLGDGRMPKRLQEAVTSSPPPRFFCLKKNIRSNQQYINSDCMTV